MGATTQDRLKRARTYAATPFALVVFLLLAAPVAFAGPSDGSPAAVDPTVRIPVEEVGHRQSLWDAGSGSANVGFATGELNRRDLVQAFSSSPDSTPLTSGSFSNRAEADSSAAAELALNHVSMTLGSGSRLFSSHTPAAPADSSSPSGSSGLTGLLALPSTGTSAAVGVDRPPLPPYGRRATWTFRVPLTRPG